MLLGGDFRQTANVVMRGTRNDTVEASRSEERRVGKEWRARWLPGG